MSDPDPWYKKMRIRNDDTRDKYWSEEGTTNIYHIFEKDHLPAIKVSQSSAGELYFFTVVLNFTDGSILTLCTLIIGIVLSTTLQLVVDFCFTIICTITVTRFLEKRYMIFKLFLGLHKTRCIGYILGASEITANLYCNYEYLYWEGCVICSIYLR